MRATITSFAVCRMDAGADLFGSEPRGRAPSMDMLFIGSPPRYANAISCRVLHGGASLRMHGRVRACTSRS